MLAETDSIRALGSAASGQAAHLRTAVAALASVPAPATAATFGPVGAGFLAALAAAVASESGAVAALANSVDASGSTAIASAAAYEDAEHRASGLVGGV